MYSRLHRWATGAIRMCCVQSQVICAASMGSPNMIELQVHNKSSGILLLSSVVSAMCFKSQIVLAVCYVINLDLCRPPAYYYMLDSSNNTATTTSDLS